MYKVTYNHVKQKGGRGKTENYIGVRALGVYEV